MNERGNAFLEIIKIKIGKLVFTEKLAKERIVNVN